MPSVSPGSKHASIPLAPAPTFSNVSVPPPPQHPLESNVDTSSHHKPSGTFTGGRISQTKEDDFLPTPERTTQTQEEAPQLLNQKTQISIPPYVAMCSTAANASSKPPQNNAPPHNVQMTPVVQHRNSEPVFLEHLCMDFDESDGQDRLVTVPLREFKRITGRIDVFMQEMQVLKSQIQEWTSLKNQDKCVRRPELTSSETKSDDILVNPRSSTENFADEIDTSATSPTLDSTMPLHAQSKEGQSQEGYLSNIDRSKIRATDSAPPATIKFSNVLDTKCSAHPICATSNTIYSTNESWTAHRRKFHSPLNFHGLVVPLHESGYGLECPIDKCPEPNTIEFHHQVGYTWDKFESHMKKVHDDEYLVKKDSNTRKFGDGPKNPASDEPKLFDSNLKCPYEKCERQKPFKTLGAYRLHVRRCKEKYENSLKDAVDKNELLSKNPILHQQQMPSAAVEKRSCEVVGCQFFGTAMGEKKLLYHNEQFHQEKYVISFLGGVSVVEVVRNKETGDVSCPYCKKSYKASYKLRDHADWCKMAGVFAGNAKRPRLNPLPNSDMSSSESSPADNETIINPRHKGRKRMLVESSEDEEEEPLERRAIKKGLESQIPELSKGKQFF
ncbi:hypothetical protein BDR26DRAFT_564347 [Obelidium mucronatum]|nr:hypothetical protein BDR26DRAFT_564347 [Obelidium mucronatum]